MSSEMMDENSQQFQNDFVATQSVVSFDYEALLKKLDDEKAANAPINSSGNSIQPLIFSPAEGAEPHRAGPSSGLDNEKLRPKLSPDDPKYQSGLTAVFDAIKALPDCPHSRELLRLCKASGALPSGEVARLSTTAEKKLEKWGNGILKVLPELYRDRPAREKLLPYLRRALRDRGLLSGKLTTAHLDVLDSALASAIRSHEKQQGPLPQDINLPTAIVRPKGLKYNSN